MKLSFMVQRWCR